MRVSNSKIKTYRRCPNAYRYKYVLKLEPRQKSVQLERGSWIHELLQAYYDGEDWRALHELRTQQFYNLFEEQREELGDLPDECLRIMRSYIRYWKEEDKHYFVVDSELDEIVTLPNGLEFHVIIDLIVEDLRTSFLWLWDHKTRKSFEAGDNMILDPQLTNYYGAAVMMGYTPLGGVMYNEIRTKPPAIPQMTSRGLTRRKNIDTDLYTYMREIKRRHLDPDNYSDILRQIARGQHERFFRRRKLPKDPPMLKTMNKELIQSAKEMERAERDGSFPRTFLSQCKWDCSYKNLCIAELYGGDTSSMVKMGFRRRKREDELEKEKPWQQG